MSEHAVFTAGVFIILLLLILYMISGLLIERSHLSFGHEASLVVLAGALISFLAYATGMSHFNEIMTFDQKIFFYFCLPPIVFASGFNMKRKVFFENFHSVMIFGVFGTILQFLLFSLGTLAISNMGVLWKYNSITG